MIRYWEHDIPRLFTAPCRCGRTYHLMDRVMGRRDDMLIIRGVTIFLSQIEAILVSIDGLEPHYQLVVDRAGNLDTLAVQVEATESLFTNADEVKTLQKTEKRISDNMKDYLGVTAKVKLVEPKSLTRF
jgi:phenylacetate-CoA ligase